MTKLPKYNHIPGACHFSPFSWGNDIHLQYSYTREKMYCKYELRSGDEIFKFVESREIVNGIHGELDSMPTNDYIGPMRLFDGLGGNPYRTEQLYTLIDAYKGFVSERLKLWSEMSSLDPESNQYKTIEAERDFIASDVWETRKQVMKTLEECNRESNYNPDTNSIRA